MSASDWAIWVKALGTWSRLAGGLPEQDARSIADSKNRTSAELDEGTYYVALPPGEQP
jgi:hypothetical protein